MALLKLESGQQAVTQYLTPALFVLGPLGVRNRVTSS